MLELIVLPLAFSYSATSLRKAASSSGIKPCVHHTVAVLAAALAIWGRAKAPAAANPTEARSSERLESLFIPRFPSISGDHCGAYLPSNGNEFEPNALQIQRRVAQLLPRCLASRSAAHGIFSAFAVPKKGRATPYTCWIGYLAKIA